MDESGVSSYSQNLQEFCGDQLGGDLGKITNLTLNYDKSVIAIYSENEGNIFILPSDFSRVLKKLSTMMS